MVDYSSFRPEPIDDRTGELWPWYPKKYGETGFPEQSPTGEALTDSVERFMHSADVSNIPPVTKLGRDLGARDIEPPSPEEVMKFIMFVDDLNRQNKP